MQAAWDCIYLVNSEANCQLHGQFYFTVHKGKLGALCPSGDKHRNHGTSPKAQEAESGRSHPEGGAGTVCGGCIHVVGVQERHLTAPTKHLVLGLNQSSELLLKPNNWPWTFQLFIWLYKLSCLNKGLFMGTCETVISPRYLKKSFYWFSFS